MPELLNNAALERSEVAANSLDKLVLVACHAVYTGDAGGDPYNDSNWLLQDFQQGETPFYIEHICLGIEIAGVQPDSLLVFSGGQTRREAGPRSEAQGYWLIAQHFGWRGRPDVCSRATTEEFARDSFENLLFGLCRFYETVGRNPESIEVVSWAFKQRRFDMHRDAINWPASKYSFFGVNNPVDLEAATKGEEKAIADFAADPLGAGESLRKKRAFRDPFNRRRPYCASCPHLAGPLGCRSGQSAN